MEEVIVHPKVFISYSWDTENGDDEHKKWVRDLATKLRSHGVDVILDQFFYGTGPNNISFGNLYM